MEPLPHEPARPAGPATAQQQQPPPRAFTQGVGTVFQFAGVLLFLGFMFVCCGSSFLSKDVAERKDWAGIGWGEWTDVSDPAHPVARAAYPANRALAVCVAVGTFLGIAVAGLGLGLQAENRAAPAGAIAVTGFAVAFWTVHLVFFVQKLHSPVFSVLASALLLVSAVLAVLAVGAWREMRRDPPPRGHEVLPADYKVPYSHFHQDPPEVRLAQEMEERRQRLLIQQKELEALEERIRRHKNDA
jgi:hypothetical protein